MLTRIAASNPLRKAYKSMDVLISGAGVAGLSVALNLGAGGHRITIVERASHLRVTGSPIDVRGHAIEIVKNMGLLDLVLARRLVMSRQSAFVDASGAVLARLPVSEISDSDDDIEIAREDMAHILGGALRPDTPRCASATPYRRCSTTAMGWTSSSSLAPASGSISSSVPTACTRPCGD